ncbi:MAG: DEAD/DEAH box helicase [Gemmatimonadaceae bacterium]
MPGLDDTAIGYAAAFSQSHAGFSLLPAQAKLYSHFTRIRAGRPGLSSWTTADTEQRLSEALRLLQAALTQRESDHGNWKLTLKRAAEILEWLAPAIEGHEIPSDMLAAAAYQLAGYPASAAGLLRYARPKQLYSRPLYSLLSADFTSVFSRLAEAWAEYPDALHAADEPRSETELLDEELQSAVVRETLGTLGIVASFLRWGDAERLEIAQTRLRTLSSLMLRSADAYSWMLAKLVTEATSVIVRSALRRFVSPIGATLTKEGRRAIEAYLRRSFVSGRTLAWPSQIRGIESLLANRSFALCTPTGSGKTTIAELAIIQSLFGNAGHESEHEEQAPIAMYMTPSRSLAAEVERKLAQVLHGVAAESVVVTGLYGGIDWGPTDAWLTADRPVVLICTYEKAEALLRFIGPLFVQRLKLVVVDEAHTVQFSGRDVDIAEARSLSLESLLTRLLAYSDNAIHPRRMVALSAVAGGVEDILAKWISGDETASAVTEPYRSTRQLIGRLEFSGNRTFEIQYDLLDRSRLIFPGGAANDTPWIPRPIPSMPFAGKWDSAGPEKSIRPALLWAALHFAAPDISGNRRAVMVYLPQQPEYVAKDFLEILTREWATERLPAAHVSPQKGPDLALWTQCLACCADYFGTSSNEYGLLERGIVLHHGRMPGLMARLLVQLIERQIIHIVVATSTLAEGVNLPFETVLLGSLRRRGKAIAPSELANVIGRAGRPGFGTEGRALVVFGQGNEYGPDRAVYQNLLTSLARSVTVSRPARSPLAELIRSIRTRWEAATDADPSFFEQWLEEVTVTEPTGVLASEPQLLAEVDALDKTLLAAITELEAIDSEQVQRADLESRLAAVWQRSFAYYASAEEERLGSAFVTRGAALERTIYPDAHRRRRLYMSSVAPGAAASLVNSFGDIKEALSVGLEYAEMSPEEQLEFVRLAVDRITSVPTFGLGRPPARTTSDDILAWWLRAPGSREPSTAIDASRWYQFVSTNYLWKFAWGLGSFIALAVNDSHNGELRKTEMQEWPETGLPWVVFWLKELVNWGTLDPVAAYLLSRQVSDTRPEAEALAQSYYLQSDVSVLSANEQLDAGRVTAWAGRLVSGKTSQEVRRIPDIRSQPLREFGDTRKPFRVIPVEQPQGLCWCDPAGFPLARSERPTEWNSAMIQQLDFTLHPADMRIESSVYLAPDETPADRA